MPASKLPEKVEKAIKARIEGREWSSDEYRWAIAKAFTPEARSAVRAVLENGGTENDAVKLAASWNPKPPRTKMTDEQKLAARVAKLPRDAQEAFKREMGW